MLPVPATDMQYVLKIVSNLTDAGGDGRSALLESFGTAVTGESSHPVLAGTLSCCLVARLSCRSNWMAVARYEEGQAKRRR